MNRLDLQALYDTIDPTEPYETSVADVGYLKAEIRRLKEILKAVIEVLVQVVP